MAFLFSPLKIRDITLKNRIVVSPMCQYSSTDGFANDWHLVHLGSRAMGGAGLVIAEATSVSPEGRITPGDLGIWDDRHIENLARITKFIHEHDSVSGIQIAHAGRKASCAVPWKGGKQLALDDGGWETLAPSNIPFRPEERTPYAMQLNDLNKLTKSFESAAKRALDAGFRVIEIHSAHGYLLHEFLSPYSNVRKDEYGGGFVNRIRLLCQVVSAVRNVWPERFPLFVRISTTEWNDELQFSPEESVELAKVLKDIGVDLIDCSSGGNIPHAKIPSFPGYQVHFAEMIKKTGIMTGAVGQIYTAQLAEEIVSENKADLVLMARELLRNPYFALKTAHDTGVDVEWPLQYLRAKNY
ncbi:MAG TPA: NADH:flavin oxidoreductase/NADH oxidase [Bacteroidales bacterium]|nr:NADH:flavin oxidoreductase/NADH oxidase [Bacteroidales bacterium]